MAKLSLEVSKYKRLFSTMQTAHSHLRGVLVDIDRTMSAGTRTQSEKAELQALRGRVLPVKNALTEILMDFADEFAG